MTRTLNAARRVSYWHTDRVTRTVEPDQPTPDPEPPAEIAPAPPRPGELRHGWTLADLHNAARLAVHTAGPMASDWHERYDTAWSAIAEHLYTATEPPQRHDLVRAGQLAIFDNIADHRHHHGFYRARTDGAVHGAGSSPAFNIYWEGSPTGSCEYSVVERLALWTILPTLTEGQREALLALAAHDDWGKAATALGLSYGAFRSQVAKGRSRFLALWHEGEVPSRVWGCDRRAGVTAADTRSGGPRTTMDAIRRRARAARRAAR